MDVYRFTGETGKPWAVILDDEIAFPVAGLPSDYEMRVIAPGGDILTWSVDLVDDGPPIIVAHTLVLGNLPADNVNWRKWHGEWITEVIDKRDGITKGKAVAFVEHILRRPVI